MSPAKDWYAPMEARVRDLDQRFGVWHHIHALVSVCGGDPCSRAESRVGERHQVRCMLDEIYRAGIAEGRAQARRQHAEDLLEQARSFE